MRILDPVPPADGEPPKMFTFPDVPPTTAPDDNSTAPEFPPPVVTAPLLKVADPVEAPDVAEPLPAVKVPVEPAIEDVPDVIETNPELFVDIDADATATEPLVLTPTPLVNDIEPPPPDTVDAPAAKDKAPPLDVPCPAVIVTKPPVPPVVEPPTMLTKPPVAEPLVTFPARIFIVPPVAADVSTPLKV
jgi:hypothetical protein